MTAAPVNSLSDALAIEMSNESNTEHEKEVVEKKAMNYAAVAGTKTKKIKIDMDKLNELDDSLEL